MKKLPILTVLGIVSLAYWFIDIINNIFFLHMPLGSLWFSSVGIGLTAIGLLTRNTFLLSSLFCALFFLELFWNIGFFSHVLFHTSFMGMTDYLFTGRYLEKDFLITSYHIFIIPFLLIGILTEKVVHTKAWMGAILFIFTVSMLTYVFAGSHETTNCIHRLDNCRAFLFYLQNVANPLRILLGIGLMTITLFIPTNYALVKLVNVMKFNRS